jgi:DNA-directed RNA polymerase specialized sigma24 family protein
MLQAERDRMLWRLVDRLPEGQRRLVCALFTSPEMSYREIAAALAIAVGSIGPTRQRALQQLDRLLVKAGMCRHDVEIAS